MCHQVRYNSGRRRGEFTKVTQSSSPQYVSLARLRLPNAKDQNVNSTTPVGTTTLISRRNEQPDMSDKPSSGELFGIPYNFERPSISRLLSAYWQPGKGMLVEKPFGVGYTLNLANWRSWIVLAVAGALFYQQQRGDEAEEDEAVEVIVDDED